MGDSNLLDQISKLRAEPKDITSNKPYEANYSTRGGSFRGRGRGSFRGARGGFPIRNRTLVVNNNTNSDSEFVSTVSSNGRKLINKSIYEKELQEKNLSKEEKVEKLKEAQFKITMKKLETRASKNRVRLDLCDRCIIDGDLYSISRYGARLVLLDIPSGIKPRRINWNGYQYERLKTGNLKLVNTKVYVTFSFLLRGGCKNPQCLFLHVEPELELVCRPFSIGGYCFRGKNCKFTHSFECPDFQLSKECPRGKNCKLTHSEKDNLDAKLLFNTLNPDYYQLPNLTKLDNLHGDPRIQKSEIEEDASKFELYDSESDDDLGEGSVRSTGPDGLEVNADFIHF
ncbi:unnamed protein product [Wickerhamomyces anomalus]